MIDFSIITSNVTSQLVQEALNAASLRHAAIASNIANVNTEGYRPLGVSFDDQIGMYKAQLFARGDDAGATRALESLRASMRYAPIAAEPTARQVQLDEEIAKLVKNTVHYQTLLTAQSKLSSITRMAVKEGRG